MSVALKRLELLLAVPQATLMHLSCSPNFLHAQYLDIHWLTHELIMNYDVRKVKCTLWLVNDPFNFCQWVNNGQSYNQLQKYLRRCTLFWLKCFAHDLVLVIPPPPIIKVSSNTRLCSQLSGKTLNAGVEPRSSRLDTRDARLNPWKFRGSSLESRGLRREWLSTYF